jgi:hypothetical protein
MFRTEYDVQIISDNGMGHGYGFDGSNVLSAKAMGNIRDVWFSEQSFIGISKLGYRAICVSEK